MGDRSVDPNTFNGMKPDEPLTSADVAQQNPASDEPGSAPRPQTFVESQQENLAQYIEENEDEEEGFFEGMLNELGPMKSAGIVAVVMVCFVVVWPKIIMPIILLLLGIKQEPQQHQSADDVARAFMGGGGGGGGGGHPLHDMMGAARAFGGGGPMPGMGGGGAPVGGGGPMPGPGMMHPGFGAPHPGVRMAQQMASSQSQTQGRRGFTSVLLPLYSIGVVIFLLYMLGKIFFKNSVPQQQRPPERRLPRNARDQPSYHLRYNPEEEKFEVDQSQLSSGRLNEELIPGQPFSRGQLNSLQQRLVDTETALHRILHQLSALPEGGQFDESTLDAVRQLTAIKSQALEQQRPMEPEGHSGSEDSAEESATEASQSEAEEEDGYTYATEGFEAERTPQGYLADLEKALVDFERFTSDYVERHHREQAAKEGGIVEPGNPDPVEPGNSDPVEQTRKIPPSASDPNLNPDGEVRRRLPKAHSMDLEGTEV